MRIAIDMRPTSVTGTGIARYAASLSGALAEAGEHELHLLYKQWHTSPSRNGARSVCAGVPMWLQAFVPAYCVKAGIDVFHGTNFVLPLLRTCAQVATIHDLTVLTHPKLHTPRNRLVTGLQMVAGLRRCDAVIAVSSATAQQIEAHFPRLRDRVTVIPLAADPRFRPASDAEIEVVRKRYAIRRHYVLFVGNKEPRKNLIALLQAVALCRRRGGWAHDLVLAGRDGQATKDILREVDRLDLGDSVKCVGVVPEDSLPALFAGASLFVYPSLAEGFGLPVLEAMACGTPVVTTLDPALCELAGPAAAYAYSPRPEHIADAMERVLHDRAYAQQLTEYGRTRAGQRRWSDVAHGTLEVYRQAHARWAAGWQGEERVPA